MASSSDHQDNQPQQDDEEVQDFSPEEMTSTLAFPRGDAAREPQTQKNQTQHQNQAVGSRVEPLTPAPTFVDINKSNSTLRDVEGCERDVEGFLLDARDSAEKYEARQLLAIDATADVRPEKLSPVRQQTAFLRITRNKEEDYDRKISMELVLPQQEAAALKNKVEAGVEITELDRDETNQRVELYQADDEETCEST